MISNSNSHLKTVSELIKLEIEAAYLKWGMQQSPRTGLHASSLLVPESEWCTRKHVLLELFPELAEQKILSYWEWKQQAVFLQGWEIHRMVQLIFKHHMQVAYTNGKPELDLTHFDPVRNIYFSPDIVFDFGSDRYVGEAKGLKQESFQQLTDDLAVACRVNETVAKAVPQANLYMHLLELKKAVILVINKNDSREFKVWVIEYNREQAQPYAQRAYKVKGSVTLAKRHNAFPKRVCQSPESPLARKCPMAKKCFSSDLEQ